MIKYIVVRGILLSRPGTGLFFLSVLIEDIYMGFIGFLYLVKYEVWLVLSFIWVYLNNISHGFEDCIASR